MIETTTKKPKDQKTEKRGLLRLRFSVFQFLGFSVLFLAFLGVWCSDAEAATKYWIGGTAGNFNDATRWSTTSGGANDTTAPGVGDVATFDGLGLGDCTMTANADLTGTAGGINITSGYSGIMTVNSGVTVKLGEGGFVQAGGTFTAGSGTNVVFDTTVTGGSPPVTLTGGTTAFQDLEIKVYLGGALTLTGTLTVNGNLTLTDGGQINGGTISVAGNVTTTNANLSYGTTTILFTGAGTQILSAGGGSGRVPNIAINKSGGTLTLQNTIEVRGSSTAWTYTAGTVDPGTSTIVFSNLWSGGAMTVDSGAMAFYDVDLNMYASGGALTVTGTLTVNRNLTLTSLFVINGGTIAVKGNVISSDASIGGTGKILLNGTDAQTLTSTGGGVIGPTLEINKPSGSILTSDPLIVGALTLTAGTLSAPATLQVTGNFTHTGGAFTHNNGLLHFNFQPACTATMNIDLATSLTVGNLKFGGGDPGCGGTATYVIASGDTFIVTGTLTHQKDVAAAGAPVIVNGGTVEVQGAGVVVGPGAEKGSTIVKLTGNGNQTYASTGGRLPVLEINKTGGTVSAAPGTTSLAVSGLTLTAGTFSAPTGTLDVGGTPLGFSAPLLTQTGGTFTHNNGLLHLNGLALDCSATTFSLDVPTSLTVGSLKLGGGDACGSQVIYTLAAGDTLLATGTLTHQRDASAGTVTVNGGTLQVQGNVVVGAGATGGTTQLQLTGTANQTTNRTAGTPLGGQWTINKSSGTVQLLSALSLSTAGQLLVITAGTLDLNSYPLTVASVISNNGTIIASGAGTPITVPTLTYSSVTNAVVRYTGNAADGAVTAKGGGFGTVIFDNPGTTFTLNSAIAVVETKLEITAGSTLDVSTSDYELTVGGDWVNNGTFVARSGTVMLNGGAGTNQTLSGTNTFYALRKTVTSAATVTFPAGLTTTVSNSLILQGGNISNRLSLRSLAPGTPAKLTLPAGKTQNLLYLDVKDNDASGGQQLIAYDSVDGGNNTNWAFQAADLTTGLVGYWKLDNAATDSAGTTNGTLVGGLAYSSAVFAPTNYANTHSASLDGVDDAIQLGTSFDLTTLPFSLSAWVRPDDFGSHNTILAKRDTWAATDMRFHWYLELGSGLVSLGQPNSNLISSYAPSAGTWTHLAVVATSNGTEVWAGGALRRAMGAFTLGSDAAAAVSLGAGGNGTGDFFDGFLDDVRVYNRALTSTEIAMLSASVGTGILRLKDTATGSTEYTASTTVTAEFLTLESTATQYCYRNTSVISSCTGEREGDPSAIAIPATPTFTTTATIQSGDGTKSLYAAVNKGSYYSLSDTIVLDTASPAVPIGLGLTAGADNTSITASATAPADADVAQLVWRYVAVDGNTSPSYPADSTAGTDFGTGVTTATASQVSSMTATSLTPLKTYGVRVWAKDAAGNVSATYAQSSLYLAPPTPRLVITAPSSATAAAAGNALTLTITAKDANGATITNYAGPYSLTWTPTGGAATTLVTSSSSGWSSGIVTASVTIGGTSAGAGTFTAVDNSENALTSGTLAFTFYPASFTVTPSSTTPTAADPFTLTATAKDSAGVAMTRYSGTANLSLRYVSPTSGTKGLSSTLIGPSSFASGVATVTLTYPDAGQVQITASDTSYVSGVTVSGTSAAMTFKPKAFAVLPKALPPALTKPYVNQPFEVEVKAVAADGTVTANYAGTVALTGEGFTLGTATRTFVPAVDKGVATIPGIRATTAGSGKLKATEGSVTGELAFGVRAATLILNSVTGQPGTLTVAAYIKDTATNLPVNEDMSTRFAVTINDQSSGSPASSPATSSPRTVLSGINAFPVTKPEEGTATIGATVLGFSMPVQPATVIWSTSASTNSTTTFNVFQFEQSPGTTFTAPPPSTFQAPSFLAPSGSGFMAPSIDSTFTPPANMGPFTMGGTRYDSAVSMGYALVAAPPGPVMFGPPAALKSRMERVAQSWRETGKIDGAQFDTILSGIQTGRAPEGAGALFDADLGMSLHQEMDTATRQQMMDTGWQDWVAPAWLMGPGHEGMEDMPMVFDASRGGWMREGNEGDFGTDEEEQEEHDEDSEDATEPDAAEPDTTETSPTP